MSRLVAILCAWSSTALVKLLNSWASVRILCDDGPMRVAYDRVSDPEVDACSTESIWPSSPST